MIGPRELVRELVIAASTLRKTRLNEEINTTEVEEEFRETLKNIKVLEDEERKKRREQVSKENERRAGSKKKEEKECDMRGREPTLKTRRNGRKEWVHPVCEMGRKWDCHEYRTRNDGRPKAKNEPEKSAAEVEVEKHLGGVTNMAINLWNKAGSSIGVMVAANSGRAGGACGSYGELDAKAVHQGHTTQEESVFSNMLNNVAGDNQDLQEKIFNRTIKERWGLMDPFDHKSLWTIQRENYQNTEDPKAYGIAWTIPQAAVCKNEYTYRRGYKKMVREYWNRGKAAPCSLTFVAGPNAGNAGSDTGSMNKTRNKSMAEEENYPLFKEAVKESARVAMDAMIEQGLEIALLAMVSHGIYAGPYREEISRDYKGLVSELLKEKTNGGTERGTYFKRAIIVGKMCQLRTRLVIWIDNEEEGMIIMMALPQKPRRSLWKPTTQKWRKRKQMEPRKKK